MANREIPFRPLPLKTLAGWIFRDLDHGDSVLGIPKANLNIPSAKLAMTRMGKTFASPLGVAAGPHTQLAQNIIAAWLVGGRFIELKTVQVLDEIPVSKPCIESCDTTFNCEWSQELTLNQSFDEYLKAWVILHALAHKMGLKDPGVFFSMSVGYNLEGILSPTVQRFLARMDDAGDDLKAAVEEMAEIYPAVKELNIPSQLSDQITLSTMHGCPPSEIEKIASYLIAERGVHTMVKMNPTLIGPEALRHILNEVCGHDITIPDLAFEHDPKFPDAMAMLRNLRALAKGRKNTFGIKLTNTLESTNDRGFLPDAMAYMSGRSLHPISLNLASKVTEELNGDIAISYCGGADAENYADLIADGLGPVTLCSDLLKPGGYARMNQFLDNLEAAMDKFGAATVDELPDKVAGEHHDGARGNLKRHAARSLTEKRFQARAKPLATKSQKPLAWFDCSSAPCMEACPAHQNVPEYLRLIAAGKCDEALKVILEKNALPCTTGNVCTHPCMEHCVRNHCDEPVQIRALKRYAAEKGHVEASKTAILNPYLKVAVVGAGPAGLSAANYLADMGVKVTIFEAHESLGGMVDAVIPVYRLKKEDLLADIRRITDKGVEIAFGKKLGRDISIASLRADGYVAVFLGIGAAAGKKLGIEGEDAEGVIDALAFLGAAKKGLPQALGDKVLIIGAGNSAMDAARTARRLVKNGTVDIVYRRTRAQMPADPEEVEACIDEGIGLKTLLAPKSVKVVGGRAAALVCDVMKLGEKDKSGRARPEPTGETLEIPCTAIISAISQSVVTDFTQGTAIQVNRGAIAVDERGETAEKDVFAGGDAVHGPSSVIQGIADGRAFALEFVRRHGIAAPKVTEEAKKDGVGAENLVKKAIRTRAAAIPTLPKGERMNFELVHGCLSDEAARAEAGRCLECDKLCSICVTVCPNRANQAYAVTPRAIAVPTYTLKGGQLVQTAESTLAVLSPIQTFNMADSCNKCGNCQAFCPTAGAPFRDKPRVWLSADGFEEDEGDRFHFHKVNGAVELVACIGGQKHSLRQDGPHSAIYVGPQAKASLDLATGGISHVEVSAPGLADGTQVSLADCARMTVLFGIAQVLPL